MNELLLSVDQGTTNTKASLVDRGGRMVFRTSAPVGLHFPAPGFVEADPDDLWTSVVTCLKVCVQAADGQPIAGVAIANQRETALIWERGSLRPLAPAMSWQCRRSADLCAALAPHGERFRAMCGLPLDPLVSASKWAWAFQQDAAMHERARRGEICLGTVDSWLMAKLTGGAVHACDHTNASRTGLMNLRSARWDAELLGLFGIPVEALPELCPSSGVYGGITAVAELAGVPILAAIGDSHGALAAHRAQSAHAGGGLVKATYGTGSSLMTQVQALGAGDERLAQTVAWSTAGALHYALEGNITMSGAAVQWVGRFLGLNDPLRETLVLAETVPDAGGVVFVPAMAGLAAPWWQTAARGVIAGLEANSTGAHLARAAVEAIALQVRDVLLAMEECAGATLIELHADGGATRNDALMQFQADVLGRPVLRAGSEELSALGAAWLGGLALGWWDEATPFAGLEPSTRFTPAMTEQERTQRTRAWRTAVRAAMPGGEPA